VAGVLCLLFFAAGSRRATWRYRWPAQALRAA
jgi:hypothetical protein